MDQSYYLSKDFSVKTENVKLPTADHIECGPFNSSLTIKTELNVIEGGNDNTKVSVERMNIGRTGKLLDDHFDPLNICAAQIGAVNVQEYRNSPAYSFSMLGTNFLPTIIPYNYTNQTIAGRIQTDLKNEPLDDKSLIDEDKLAKNVEMNQRIHEGESNYTCELCCKTFKDQKYLEKHKIVHSSVKPFSCVICSKTFRRKEHLERHLYLHSGEKPYECDLCGKKFARKAYLVEHRIIHTGLKPYSCNLCGKAFNKKSLVHQHKSNMHPTSDKRLFSCELCNKQFKNKFHLGNHRIVHTGDRPFSCDMCEKSFARKETLVNHRRAHIGDKPFVCQICSKTFSKNSTLKAHKKLHAS